MRLAHTIALAMLVGAASTLPAAAKTLRVPQQYTLIQDALNAAKPGDTVQVSPKSGGAAYNEAVTVNTPNIVLQGKNNPVIDGAGVYPLYQFPVGGVDVRANHVAVRGLTVKNFTGSPAVNVGYYDYDANQYKSFSDVEVSANTLQKNALGVHVSGFIGDFFGGYSVGGYKILNNAVADSKTTEVGVEHSSEGVVVESVMGALISGNRVIGSTNTGLDVNGVGLTITGNDIGANGGIGVSVFSALYNPAVNAPANPNPPASIVTLNSIHDNGLSGLQEGSTQIVSGLAVSGTLTISANTVFHNVGYGIYLADADYSTVALNSSTCNVPAASADPDVAYLAGVGIYADPGSYNPDTFLPNPLTISANQVSGNARDGIALNQIDNCTVSRNVATGNYGIGIHLLAGSGSAVANIVTLNYGSGNTLYDAQDDALAFGSLTFNTWSNNRFGTANPISLKN